jgi:aspartate/methionine/tyrosine aminotransferase
MKLERFDMERLQSQWENAVKYNLSESGVHPMTVDELIEDRNVLDEWLGQRLGYNPTNGTEALRDSLSGLYNGVDRDNILVTNGGAEANFLALWNLIEDGDEVLVMLPNYMQTWGIARGLGAFVKPLWLREELAWAPDLDELKRLVTNDTKLIIVCNPNNPTGALLSEEALQAICDAAGRYGAWILADEVYQNAERDGTTTPSFWGRYDRTLVTNSLSKAYGLPGLRIGWMVGPKEVIADLWAYKDYTTIAPGTLSDRLARIALAPARRAKIITRTRAILNHNFPILKAWLDAHDGLFHMIEPRAGAIAYIKHHLKINSTELAMQLLHEKSVLIVPGDYFHMDHYLRIGYGGEPECLRQGLNLVHEAIEEIIKL